MISKHVDADGEVTFYMDEDAELNTLQTMDKSGTVNGKKMDCASHGDKALSIYTGTIFILGSKGWAEQ